MKSLLYGCIVALLGICSTCTLHATVFRVSSVTEFNTAQSNAQVNDSIIWNSGTYTNVSMNITQDSLYVGANVWGETIFNGSSKVDISSDYVTLEGFQYVGGNVSRSDIINISGSYAHIHQINIRAFTSYKYLVIRESSQYVVVSYCNFENRLNLADQNILSILVDANNPGYHKIQHCSFKNFDGTGNDMGIEPIRIGLSSQANRISRSLVEYCYFTQCDGDGELISSKATQNVYRFNTFEDNTKAELVLRHGSEAIVYGNFFLRGKGGVRIREGQNHYIYNNYFAELNDRPIFIQNESSDPVGDISIAFNTIVECDGVRLGGSGNNKPTNVTFSNNILADPLSGENLFEDPTGTETWIGNIAFGRLGINVPASGISTVDPQLQANSQGFFGLGSNSPAIDAAQPGFLSLPQFSGMDPIDTDILFDMMGQARPAVVADRDLGCNEFPHNTLISPIATEANTGPSYNTSPPTSLEPEEEMVQNLFSLYPNPASDRITLKLDQQIQGEVTVEIFDIQGKKLKDLFHDTVFAGQGSIEATIGSLAAGVYTLKLAVLDRQSGNVKVQALRFSKQ